MIQHKYLKYGKVSPIYLLPNMITLGAMFCGFYAIIQSINASFINSGIAILFAMILDSFDGRVARLTHTSSPFGAELDSLADAINFGVAPAVIMFNWQLYNLGKLGWLVAFVYCACAVLRLARFNTMLGIVDKKYFIGLPSPAAAALVVGYVYMCANYSLHNLFFMVMAVIITLVAAGAMVSNIKFYSFKEFNFHKKARFRALLLGFMLLTLLVIYPDFVIYGFFVIYIILGCVFSLFALRSKAGNIADNNQQSSTDNGE